MNPKQAAFVRAYLVHHNATQAAVDAGYSSRTAKQQGSRLLTVADVAAAIAAGEAEQARKLEDIAARLRAQNDDVTFFDPVLLADPETGELITDLRKMPKAARHNIAGFKRKRILKVVGAGDEKEQVIEETYELKLRDRNAAFDSRVRIEGLAKGPVEGEGSGERPVNIRISVGPQDG